jgi:hypothetical protein
MVTKKYTFSLKRIIINYLISLTIILVILILVSLGKNVNSCEFFIVFSIISFGYIIFAYSKVILISVSFESNFIIVSKIDRGRISKHKFDIKDWTFFYKRKLIAVASFSDVLVISNKKKRNIN